MIYNTSSLFHISQVPWAPSPGPSWPWAHAGPPPPSCWRPRGSGARWTPRCTGRWWAAETVKSWGFGHGMPCWVHGKWGLKKWGCSFSVGLGLGRVPKSRGDLTFLVLTNYWRPGDIFVFVLLSLASTLVHASGTKFKLGHIILEKACVCDGGDDDWSSYGGFKDKHPPLKKWEHKTIVCFLTGYSPIFSASDSILTSSQHSLHLAAQGSCEAPGRWREALQLLQQLAPADATAVAFGHATAMVEFQWWYSTNLGCHDFGRGSWQSRPSAWFRRCHRDGVSWGKHGLFGVGLCGMPGTPSTRDCPGLNTDIEPRKQIGNGFVLDICSCFRGCMLGFWASVDWMHCWTWKTFTLNGTVNGISMDLNREISSNGIFQWYTNG